LCLCDAVTLPVIVRSRGWSRAVSGGLVEIHFLFPGYFFGQRTGKTRDCRSSSYSETVRVLGALCRWLSDPENLCIESLSTVCCADSREKLDTHESASIHRLAEAQSDRVRYTTDCALRARSFIRATHEGGTFFDN
jgi:hypothetical protein